jgi:PAS domain S-box-containing protein
MHTNINPSRERTLRAEIERLEHSLSELTPQDAAVLNPQLEQLENCIRHLRGGRAASKEADQRILDALMEYIPEGITIADAPDVNIRMVSKHGQELTGRQPEEIAGIPMDEHPQQWQIYYPDSGQLGPAEELPLSRATLHGEVVRNEQLLLKRGDGTTIVILCNAGPIRDEQGQITGGIIAWRDTSELRQAQADLKNYADQLEKVNQELNDFAFTASHDLQEPLRKIQSFGSLLESNYSARLGPDGQEYLRRMTGAAQRMQEMIHGLLAYARVTTHKQPTELVDLNKILTDVLLDLEARINETRCSLETRPLPSICCDRLQMRQLLQNLIGNAIKYHLPGQPPVIKIWSEPLPGAQNTPESVLICIQDEGIGIDPKKAGTIFKPFVRLHGRFAYEGTGMGLAICQKIVERHGGKISVTSTPGQGATFSVRLPIEQV